LHFICFNTQIGRQFEFIQHTWMNSSKFDGLYEDDDPLTGPRGANAEMRGGAFTVQREPVRKRVTGMPRFVTVRGGGYFFMPGIRAVRYIASQPAAALRSASTAGRQSTSARPAAASQVLASAASAVRS
jgi:hypothetical protein